MFLFHRAIRTLWGRGRFRSTGHMFDTLVYVNISEQRRTGRREPEPERGGVRVSLNRRHVEVGGADTFPIMLCFQSESLLLLDESVDMASTSSSFSLL